VFDAAVRHKDLTKLSGQFFMCWSFGISVQVEKSKNSDTVVYSGKFRCDIVLCRTPIFVPTHFLCVHVFAVHHVMSRSFSHLRALPSPCCFLLVVILACPLHSDTHSLFFVPSGGSQERADARLREQILLLEQATKQEKDKETLVDSLRREAEQRKFQVCFTISMHVLCVCVCVHANRL